MYDHITAPSVTVPSGTPIEVVAKTLLACEGRQVPVMLQGRPIGVVRQEDVDDCGILRDGSWVGWRDASSARDVMSTAPIIASDQLEPAIRALLDDTVVVVCRGDGSLVGVFTEHDGVRVALEHLPDLLVRNVASTPVHAVDVRGHAAEADALMKHHGVRHVVVLEDERAVGMISHRDLIAAGVRRGRTPLTAEVWARRPLLAVPDSASLMKAASILVDERIGAVPVLDSEGKAVAVLTRRDVVRAAVARMRG